MDPFQSDEKVFGFRFCFVFFPFFPLARRVRTIPFAFCYNFIFPFCIICTNIILSVVAPLSHLTNLLLLCIVVCYNFVADDNGIELIRFGLKICAHTQCSHSNIYIYLQLGEFFIVIHFHLIRAVCVHVHFAYQASRLIDQTRSRCAPTSKHDKEFFVSIFFRSLHFFFFLVTTARPKVGLFCVFSRFLPIHSFCITMRPIRLSMQ